MTRRTQPFVTAEIGLPGGSVIEVVTAGADNRRAELQLFPWLKKNGRSDLAGLTFKELSETVPDIYGQFLLWCAATRLGLYDADFDTWFDTTDTNWFEMSQNGAVEADPTSPGPPGG